MGILDSLEQAAGLGAAPTAPAAGAAAGPSGVVGAVLQMLQSQPGGLGGVLQQFQSAGLGGLASSWLGAGANQPLSPGQVQTTLGSGPVAEIADKLGLSHEQAAGHIAQLLPLIVDHLSPNGQTPAGGGASDLGALLSHFTGG